MEAHTDLGQTDVEALQLLAHQAAIAIENARLNQLKDEFLSIVSHELKTPVTSIKGFSQVLKRRLSPESLEQSGRYLDVINHQADRLTALTNDLLDLSRIQTGRFSFDLDTVEYGTLLQEVVAEMQLMNVHHPIELVAPENVRVWGNGERLRQVLVNLIDNAVKHGPRGGTVRVKVESHDGADIVLNGPETGHGATLGEAGRNQLPGGMADDGHRLAGVLHRLQERLHLRVHTELIGVERTTRQLDGVVLIGRNLVKCK